MLRIFTLSFLLVFVSLNNNVNAGGAFDTAPTTPSWQGFYLGGHLGAGFSDDLFSDRIKSIYEDDEYTDYETDFNDDAGFIGGGHIGYNFQRGNIVFGVEGDISYSDIENTLNYSVYDKELDNFLSENTEKKIELDYLASIRARLGYASDKFLVYGTLGVAFTEVKGSTDRIEFEYPDTETQYLSNSSDEENLTGFVIGGGAATKLTDKISARAEALHYTFEKDDRGLDFDVTVVRGGLSFHLN